MVTVLEIKKIAEAIGVIFDVKSIILFGSYANGFPRENSDVDLCIITDEKKKKVEILRNIRRNLLNRIHFPLDLLVYSSDEFNWRSKRINSLEFKIANNGIGLYGR